MNERDIPRPAGDDEMDEPGLRAHLTEHGWGGHHRGHHGPGRGKRARARFGGYGGPGFGGPGFGGPEFGDDDRPFPGPPGGPFGPGFGWPRGRAHGRGRARRGDVRAAALSLLAEQPLNGYQIIQLIAERSGGLWRASPGSVYPALAQLEDENLIELQAAEHGRRAYALTEAGRGYVAEHAAELNAAWTALSGEGASAAVDMRSLVRQVHLAAFQVVSAGTDAQVEQARTVLTQARRALYRILAEDDAAGDAAVGSSAQ